MSTAPIPESLEKQVERLRLRADNHDGLYRELRDLCNGLFKITEMHRALIEELARLAGAELIVESDRPTLKRKPN
jgi:hypothetical protein